MTYKKKLIEVALPLEAINAESAREKSIRHGHPSTLHLWWARRPLATCRAVLFASLVDDPDDPEANPAFVAACRQLEKGKNAQDHDTPRQRLFDFIEKLVKWENSNNEQILATARELINLACDGNPPPVLDPFCGGGSIPLEAQRLGLKAYASDLNPVAVLITKALIEIPPKFAGLPPVNPEWQRKSDHEKAAKLSRGAEGLAEDVRYYGKWMRDEAEKRIGQYYPKAKLPDGGEATVIAWLWARTVTCPNPACGCQMPLVRSFELSKKAGKRAWVEPVVEPGNPPTIRFEVRTGQGTPPEGTVNRKGATCIACGTAVPFTHIRAEGKAGRMGAQLMAIVAEGDRGRIYLEPDREHSEIAGSAEPAWKPQGELHGKTRVNVSNYGFNEFSDLFTDRQLLALTTFSDLVGEARARVLADACAAGRPASQSGADDTKPLADGGTGAQAYADAVATYLAEALSKLSCFTNSIAYWRAKENKSACGMGRQAIPMTWDYTEVNPFAGAGGDFQEIVCSAAPKVISNLPSSAMAEVHQQDASLHSKSLINYVYSTDPPYYDNIGYADLSDYFYIWLKRSLSEVYPESFGTLMVPKTPELVATPYRFGGDKGKAKEFFEEGLRRSFRVMRESQHSGYPLTVYYAFKQAESEEDDGGNTSIISASTGWETMLMGLLQAGYQVTGTWPVRTENSTRLISTGGGGTNALASSIVLVCRPRPDDAPVTTRRDLTRQLEAELPQALRELQDANIAPVDLAQAAIGPGMAVYSRFAKVLEASGEPMRVRDALVLINQLLYEHLNEGGEELDSETQFALAWFKQFQYAEGKYGEAEVLAKSKNIAVESLVGAGIAVSRAGKVRLLERGEYDHDVWDAAEDTRLNAWEVTQRMIWALENQGVKRAAQILRAVGGLGETARELSYRLYTLCDQKGWAKEALAYNTLVQSWRDIEQRMRDIYGGPRQAGMDLGE